MWLFLKHDFLEIDSLLGMDKPGAANV
jgi:hypothetical protein